MDIRTVRPDDLDALTSMAQQSLPFDTLSSSYLYERIWRDPDTDDNLLLGAWDGDTLIAYMLGVTRPGKTAPMGYVKLFATHPNHRGQGVATRLLQALEERLAAKGVQQVWVSGCAPWYIFAGVDVRYTPALLFLQKAGYAAAQDAVNMHVDLHALPDIPAAVMVRPQRNGYLLRRIEPRDAAPLRHWVQQVWGQNWAVESLMALQSDPPTGFVALKEESIVGFAVYDGARPGWFGPMGTEANLRGQGIGGALYLLCLEDMQRKGYTCAEISWAGPIIFYSRLSGAYIHRVFRRWKKDLTAPTE